MKIKLIPFSNFDSESKNTIKIVKIAEDKLTLLNINTQKTIEFYDELFLFIKRILPQVKNYGLNEKQSIEFIKASLNLGAYGTYNIKENAIIEMNFNPHFIGCYPAIHFLKLLIHESLHLFLYSRLNKDIYKKKFRFFNGKYIGNPKILQLDEGFAGLSTNKILKNFNFAQIRNMPIYSGLNMAPEYQDIVDGLDIKEFNYKFNNLYEENSKKGFAIMKKRFSELENLSLKEKIQKMIMFIQEELNET